MLSGKYQELAEFMEYMRSIGATNVKIDGAEATFPPLEPARAQPGELVQGIEKIMTESSTKYTEEEMFWSAS